MAATSNGHIFVGNVRAESSPKETAGGFIKLSGSASGPARGGATSGMSGTGKGTGMGGGVFGACTGSVPSRSSPGVLAITADTLPAASIVLSEGGGTTNWPSFGGMGGGGRLWNIPRQWWWYHEMSWNR